MHAATIPQVPYKLLEISFLLAGIPTKLRTAASKFIKSAKEFFRGDIRDLSAVNKDGIVVPPAEAFLIIPAFHREAFDRDRSRVNILVLWVTFDIEEDIFLGSGQVVFVSLIFLDEFLQAI